MVYGYKTRMAKLGQHFMIDQNILNRVVAAAGLKGSEHVLELGAGNGVLTRELLNRCRVTAIERDAGLASRLMETFPDLDVIQGDGIKIEWPKFDKCVSNLPYLISKKFIMKLLQEEFELAVIVLQEEFAQKLVAKPGDKNYGAVSVCTQLSCSVELLDVIPKNAFKPQPKVSSRIVRLNQGSILERGFLEYVQKTFQKRNKKLGNKRVRDHSPQEFLEMYRNNSND
jgi:16S rRNA (adenine1518-N6/adenine1519-N6)-dimethyltransferase